MWKRDLRPALLAFLILLHVLALAAVVKADDPPKPVVPVASVADPAPKSITAGGIAVLDGSGSVTNYPLAWSVNPPSAIVKFDQDGRRSIFALIPNLAENTDYLVTVTAMGKDVNGDPVGASKTITFTTRVIVPVVVPPVVTPPAPPGPPTPGPATTDVLGMTAATRDIVQPLTWTDTSLAWRQTTLANAFLAQATLAPSYPTPQAMVTATATALKVACGQVYPDWQSMLLGPLEAKVNTLRVGGQIKTVADLAEAFTEIVVALKEAPIARR